MSRAMEDSEDRILRRRRPGLAGARADLAFVLAYVRHNLAAAVEYRASFVMRVIGMIVNDTFWLAFWALYFRRFPVIHGWTFQDVVTLWSVVAMGFGLGVAVCGNSLNLAAMIGRGDLDYYLALPKNVLVHVLISRMGITAWGDVLFGAAAYGIVVHPDAMRVVLFVGLAVAIGLIVVSFAVLTDSLAFVIGGSEGLAGQLQNGLLSFSTYPMSLFDKPTRILLYTVLPAAFVSYLPVTLLRAFDWHRLALMLGYTTFLTMAAWAAFHAGLRRYESGNLVGMRG